MLRTVLIAAGLSLLISSSAKAFETTYFSGLTTIDELMTVCESTVAASRNVHCVRGLDRTIKGNEKWKPYDEQKNLTKDIWPFNHLTADRMKLSGEVPKSIGKEYFVFLIIYREYFQDAQFPILKAQLVTYRWAPKEYQTFSGFVESVPFKAIREIVEELPIISMNSDDGKMFQAQLELKIDSIKKSSPSYLAKQKIKPKCDNVSVTGYATSNHSDFAAIKSEPDLEDLIKRAPLVCTDRTRVGRYGPNFTRRCDGFVFLKDKPAKILDWSEDVYVIDTEIDFLTGRIPLQLLIRRADAACVNLSKIK